jgi:hypothetical protein
MRVMVNGTEESSGSAGGVEWKLLGCVTPARVATVATVALEFSDEKNSPRRGREALGQGIEQRGNQR